MNPLKIFLAFLLMMILGYFAVGFSSSVQAPDNSTDAGKQYENLTEVTGIANVGIQSTFLIITIVMVLAAVFFFAQMVKIK